jgi:hypothetical protein
MDIHVKLDPSQGEQLRAVATASRMPASRLISLSVDRLLDQVRRDGSLVLPVHAADERAA